MLNFMWLDIELSLQTNDSKWLDSLCDSTLTRLKKIFDDSDPKGLWLWLDSDSTKMTRAHHYC